MSEAGFMSRQSPGGKAAGLILRAEAIARYDTNPQFCWQCGKKIEVGKGKVGEARKKKFCNRSCFGKFNGVNGGGAASAISRRRQRICKSCGAEMPWTATNVRVCASCRAAPWERVMSSPKSAMHRCSISFNARQVLFKSDRQRKCEECGYDRHVEACHKRAVADFPDDALMSEVNGLDNLMWLCPNHHWEFDHKLPQGGAAR